MTVFPLSCFWLSRHQKREGLERWSKPKPGVQAGSRGYRRPAGILSGASGSHRNSVLTKSEEVGPCIPCGRWGCRVEGWTEDITLRVSIGVSSQGLDSASQLRVVLNPFFQLARLVCIITTFVVEDETGTSFSLWLASQGPFGFIGPLGLGRWAGSRAMVVSRLIPEWYLPAGWNAPGMDVG